MSVYSAYKIANGFRMVKWDDLYNVEATYDMRQGRNLHCSCFQANKPTCRHREMMKLFAARKAINSGRFYDYDQQRWYPPFKL